MALKQSPQTLTDQILKFILTKKVVHYSDLMDYTGCSRKTIAKYLKQAEVVAARYQVSLIRKRGHGIYLAGDQSALLANIGVTAPYQQESEEERRLDILTMLIKLEKPILLDDLAEHFYISHSTLERDLRVLKKEYNLQYQSTNSGIQFVGLEKDKRMLLGGKVLQKYWGGQKVTQSLKTGQMRRNFTVPANFFQYVDKETLHQAQQAMQEFAELVNININEYQYESLLIHITIAFQRIKKGEFLSKGEEHQAPALIAQHTTKLVEILTRIFKCEIPQAEVAYLNIHVMAIEDGYINLDGPDSLRPKLVKWLKNSLREYDEELLKNLGLHLIPALSRIQQGVFISNPYLDKIKTNFPVAFDKSLELALELQKEFSVRLPENEIAYLALHFESFIERSQVKLHEVRIAIVCSTGYGTAALLKQRIQEKLPTLEIVATLSVAELIDAAPAADLVVSTIPLKLQGTAVMTVSPFLSEKELELLQITANRIQKDKYARHAFASLLSPTCIITKTKAANKEEAIVQITQRMVAAGFVEEQMTQSALDRERLASTVINEIAIPHGDLKNVKKPVIGIMTSATGIKWGKDTIYTVFFVALNRQVEDEMDDIYSYFYEVIQNGAMLRKLRTAQTVEAVITLLSD